MIYPANIILWITLLLPFSAAAAHIPLLKHLLYVMILLIALVGVIDALAGHRKLSQINISLPELTRFSIFSENLLKFTISSELAGHNIITFKPLLPDELAPQNKHVLLELGDSDRTFFEWHCFPTKRGDFLIKTCFVEIKSIFGFWYIRKKITLENNCVRVYPDLQKERQNLAAFFLNRADAGLHLNRLLGQGKEFEKLREYIPGDSMDIISWKATAKRNKPISKVYQQEQTQEIYAVIDVSRLSGKIVDGKSALEYYLAASLVLGLVAEKQKDNFGIIAFDSRIIRFIKSKGGKQHYNACREAIYSLQPNDCSPDYNSLFSFIRSNIRKRVFLSFLIDLDDAALAESFIEDVHLVSHKHVCVINSLRHTDINPLFEGEQIDSVNEIYSKLAGHIKWAELMSVRNALYRWGINFTLTEFNSFSTEIISQYLNLKRRQQL